MKGLSYQLRSGRLGERDRFVQWTDCRNGAAATWYRRELGLAGASDHAYTVRVRPSIKKWVHPIVFAVLLGCCAFANLCPTADVGELERQIIAARSCQDCVLNYGWPLRFLEEGGVAWHR